MSDMDESAADATEASAGEEEAMDSANIEAPEADSVEQHTLVRGDHDELPPRLSFDVNEADAAEQSRIVELDEDDYR